MRVSSHPPAVTRANLDQTDDQAVCVVTGLIGTAAMPILERVVGLERAGAWSIWYVNQSIDQSIKLLFCVPGQGDSSCVQFIWLKGRFEISCLAPVILAFFYGTGMYGEHGEIWNSVLLFGGESNFTSTASRPRVRSKGMLMFRDRNV